jgi:hypothetical protein
MPVASFRPPKGVVQARIDAWTGGRPGPWTKDTVTEWFINGTQPGAANAVDPPGLLYTPACGGWRVDPVKAELGPRLWDHDVLNWTFRARRGVGVVGPYDTRTAYFWGRSGWGGQLVGACAPRPQPKPDKPPNDHGGGHDPGGGGGGGGPDPSPAPSPEPSPKPKP